MVFSVSSPEKSEHMRFPNSFEDEHQYAACIVETLDRMKHWIVDIHPFDVESASGNEFMKKYLPQLGVESWLYETPLDLVIDALSSIMLGETTTLISDEMQNWVNELRSLKLPLPEKLLDISNDEDCTRRGMNRKKLHEVDILCPFIDDICQHNGIDVVVDFGAGLGYLTHELSKSHPVIAIESDQDRTNAAKGRSKRLSVRQKTKQDFPIEHVSEFLTTENAHKIFKEAITNHDSKSFLLTGLHACGDLASSTMIELFENVGSIKAMVSVGCCYHLMDTVRFPKSSLLKQLNFSMDKSGLKLSCHTFANFDKHRVLGLWNAQCIRAVVQVKGKLVLAPEDNLEVSLRKVERKFELAPTGLNLDNLQIILRKVAFLSTLRALLGPLIEAAVLLDRYSVLKESGKNVNLVPLFNPLLSPRNYALVAIKPGNAVL